MTAPAFKATLTRLGVSPADAADLIGVDTSAILRWRSGSRKVPAAVDRLVTIWERYPDLVRPVLEDALS